MEELYVVLDKDQDNKIYYDEMEEAFLNFKVEISSVLRVIRRAILAAGVNVLNEMREKDIHKRNTVSFYDFAGILKKHCANAITPIELNALYKHFADSASQGRDPTGALEDLTEHFIDYQKFFTEMENACYDLTVIRQLVKGYLEKYNTNFERLFEMHDSKCDGVLDFQEFSDMLTKRFAIQLPEEEIKEAFQAFDLDKSGFITPLEFEDVIKGKRQSSTMSMQVMQRQKNYEKVKV